MRLFKFCVPLLLLVIVANAHGGDAPAKAKPIPAGVFTKAAEVKDGVFGDLSINNGKKVLHLKGSDDVAKQAAALDGKKVVITGTVTGDTVAVDTIKEAPAKGKPK